MSQITFLDDDRPVRSRSPVKQVPVSDATFEASPTVSAAPVIETPPGYPPKELFTGPLPPQYQNNLTFSPLPVYQSSFPSTFPPSTPSFTPQSSFAPQYSPIQQNDNSPTAMYDTNGSRYLSMNCIDIANHIRYCPVCSQLHKSNSPLYMSVIIILLIISICLGKKYFE